jgi:hypothetical protein
MAQGIYNRLKYNLAKKLVDLSTDTIKVVLLNNSHTFNPDHNVLTDINTNEISGTGYTTGGVALTGQTVTQDDTNDLMKFDANDSSWTSATFSAYHAALNNVTASNNLVGSIDFGGVKSVTAGTFLIQWSANGIVRLT